MADTLKHSMDENNRELYALPTLAKFLGTPPKAPKCKKYGPIISDFIKRETHKSFEQWIKNYDECVASIWSLPVLERLQKLQEYLADFKEYAYDTFVMAYVGHYNATGPSSCNLVYSFVDEHWGGDMDTDIIGLVKYAVANYVEPEWPAELPRLARLHTLEMLMNYMEEIHVRIQLECIEVKHLIRYGH